MRATVDGGGTSPTIGKERHSSNNSLRDVILGGQDGLVNMLGIALGVVAAGGSTHVLVVTGIAAAITESISMGAVAYTSFGSDRDFYLAEKKREQNEISSRLGKSMRLRASEGSCSTMLLTLSRPIGRPG